MKRLLNTSTLPIKINLFLKRHPHYIDMVECIKWLNIFFCCILIAVEKGAGNAKANALAHISGEE